MELTEVLMGLSKYNENHDEKGQFASGGGAHGNGGPKASGGGKVASVGKYEIHRYEHTGDENGAHYITRDHVVQSSHPSLSEAKSYAPFYHEQGSAHQWKSVEGSLLKTESKKPYGDVKYADPGHQADKKPRYPIDTEEHIRAAWSYINKPKNGGEYSSGDLANIKSRIVSAWKSKIDKDGPPSAEKAVVGDLNKGLEGGEHYNSTSLQMFGRVVNGKFTPESMSINDCDVDPGDEEETPGSPEAQREEAHYERVIEAVADFLTSEDGHEKLAQDVKP